MGDTHPKGISMMNKALVAGLLVALPIASANAGGTVTMPAAVPFLEGSGVSKNIQDECGLPEYVAEQVRTSLEKAGYTVTTGTDSKKGDFLDMHIAGAVSQGNAFTGHHKAVTVTGKLLRDGKVVGSFTDLRNSMGGAWAGYKGSCTVLHRCVATIGQDVAKFVANPREDAQLGDAH